MHIVILGAEALGTVLGAHLSQAGEEVTLVARGNRAAYLQEHGATMTGLADFTVPIHVVTDPHQVREADVLIVTVKTYDMEVALESVKHMQVGSVLSIQNGVVKDEQLAQIFGWEKVLGAMAWFSAEVLPTGAISIARRPSEKSTTVEGSRRSTGSWMAVRKAPSPKSRKCSEEFAPLQSKPLSAQIRPRVEKEPSPPVPMPITNVKSMSPGPGTAKPRRRKSNSQLSLSSQLDSIF
jgi:2-dehydropantoate 2-reductase